MLSQFLLSQSSIRSLGLHLYCPNAANTFSLNREALPCLEAVTLFNHRSSLSSLHQVARTLVTGRPIVRVALSNLIPVQSSDAFSSLTGSACHPLRQLCLIMCHPYPRLDLALKAAATYFSDLEELDIDVTSQTVTVSSPQAPHACTVHTLPCSFATEDLDAFILMIATSRAFGYTVF